MTPTLYVEQRGHRTSDCVRTAFGCAHCRTCVRLNRHVVAVIRAVVYGYPPLHAGEGSRARHLRNGTRAT